MVFRSVPLNAVPIRMRSADALGKLANEISTAGPEAIAVPTDVTDAGAVERLVRETVQHFGRLDCAFNNAAGGGQARRAEPRYRRPHRAPDALGR